MDDLQTIWDLKFEKMRRDGSNPESVPWLMHWLHLVPPAGCRRALDVGCGSGQNTKLLLDQGFTVTAIDISVRALELCRRQAPEARIQWADLREGLPFAGDYFELIVADQSLHYFPWVLTNSITGNIADRLVPGGLIIGRFNSAGNANYGAELGKPVRGEPNLYIIDGIQKRFFTRECFCKLFGKSWSVVAMAEMTISRFDSRKLIWEVVATRSGGD